ncbi:glycosyltransferase family 2 protein [Leptospira kanakyensis]|uniref:Glycosyltransferase family 2 protein n=1 Tax=Leptospira kanakyensis TaxID=2484968 RepID=A0A6N4QGA6_9LEPT|nr:glycosyltransferase family 2 protein [Leptospira kanakyensis]TGK53400.1 glycosyltransferase family 2 protein [Leptospira kanakyensis]TGK57196.1 glycosyltransferase family 2 protein [Leptospira kanakyensis]TGK72906.1 glycosyltransferase family 2 protein [Leptospira kanakyensis]
MKPKISVCMATYNGEKYIAEQLNSILKQLAENDEIIVSDDSSTDNTVKILQTYAAKDPRIQLFLYQTFRDPIQNFQNALKKSTGDYIYLSDQDDVWLDNKVNTINTILESYDLVLHDSIVTDENLNITAPSFFKIFGSKKGILKNVIKSSYYGSCMAFRRKILENALPFPKTKEIGQDLWLGLVAELTGKVTLVETPYIYYRRHQNTFTLRGLGGTKRNIFQIIRGRLVMFYELIKFSIRKIGLF